MGMNPLWSVAENQYAICKTLTAKDNISAMEIQKYLYYTFDENDKDKIAKPTDMPDVKIDLLHKNVFPYPFNPDVNNSIKNFMCVYFDSFYPVEVNRKIRDDIFDTYLIIDIFSDKNNVEVIVDGEDGEIVVPRYEKILELLTGMFYGNREYSFMGEIKLKQVYMIQHQQRYIGRKVVFGCKFMG